LEVKLHVSVGTFCGKTTVVASPVPSAFVAVAVTVCASYGAREPASKTKVFGVADAPDTEEILDPLTVHVKLKGGELVTITYKTMRLMTNNGGGGVRMDTVGTRASRMFTVCEVVCPP